MEKSFSHKCNIKILHNSHLKIKLEKALAYLESKNHDCPFVHIYINLIALDPVLEFRPRIIQFGHASVLVYSFSRLRHISQMTINIFRTMCIVSAP